MKFDWLVVAFCWLLVMLGILGGCARSCSCTFTPDSEVVATEEIPEGPPAFHSATNGVWDECVWETTEYVYNNLSVQRTERRVRVSPACTSLLPLLHDGANLTSTP